MITHSVVASASVACATRRHSHLRNALAWSGAALGLLYLSLTTRSLLAPDVYRKDFIEDYLFGQAVRHGIDPYRPLPELAHQFIGPLPTPVFPHASPHPPAIAWLSLPLAWLTYPQAAAAWLVFDVACLFLSVRLLAGAFVQKSQGLRSLAALPGVAWLTLGALAWGPTWTEVVTGQLMTLILVLLAASWLSLRSRRDLVGGGLLGLVVALKLFAWPIVIYLAVRRQWRAVLAAAATSAAAHLAAGLLIGWQPILEYYLHVGTAVAALYRVDRLNVSLWTLGWRLFDGTGSAMQGGYRVAPLVAWPTVAAYVSPAAVLGLVLVALRLALRAHCFDTAFGVLVCASLLVNPVAWLHYLVVALIPIGVALHRLTGLGWPRREVWRAALVGLVLYLSGYGDNMVALVSGRPSLVTNGDQIGFNLGLLTLLPMLGVLGLLSLLWRLDHVGQARTTEMRGKYGGIGDSCAA